METYEFAAVPTRVLEQLWSLGVDELGEAPVLRTAGGGDPLRCCLTLASPGDALALVSHRPMAVGGPYAEVGPVFVHPKPCAGWAGTDFPVAHRPRRMVLRPYATDGQMLEGTVAEPGQAPELLARLFDDPEVALIQSRNVVAGCWNFTARRVAR